MTNRYVGRKVLTEVVQNPEIPTIIYCRASNGKLQFYIEVKWTFSEGFAPEPEFHTRAEGKVPLRATPVPTNKSRNGRMPRDPYERGSARQWIYEVYNGDFGRVPGTRFGYSRDTLEGEVQAMDVMEKFAKEIGYI